MSLIRWVYTIIAVGIGEARRNGVHELRTTLRILRLCPWRRSS